jgi:predicted PurR-regulated permease PerM
VFLSFAMEPAVQWLDQRGMRRGLGTFAVGLIGTLLMIGFFAAMVPLLVNETRNLIQSAPQVLSGLAEQAERLPGQTGERVAEWLDQQREALPGRLPDIASTVGRGALGVGTTVLSGVFGFLTTALITFYLVADGPKLRRTLVGRLSPDRQREFLTMYELAIAKTGGYVYSRVLTAVVSTIFHAIAFAVIGVPYFIPLAVWVGVTSSLIPVVGTYIGGALPLIIALADEPLDALWVLIAITLYQQVENYLVAPRINAATMELHPAIAFLAVIVGAALLGATGALLALPVAAIIAALASTYGHRHEVLDHGLVSGTREQRSGGG